MDRRDWQLEGRRLGRISKASPWWVGDWLAFGTEQWGDRYTEAKALTGYDIKTLRNLRYVSTSVAKDVRVPDLTWATTAWSPASKIVMSRSTGSNGQ